MLSADKRQSTFEQFRMLECLSLAERGAGYVSPNPLVGAIVVKNGTIVGRGYHRRFGGPHAEIHALRQAGDRARGATLFVNLEPCCHSGKTPPCTDAIIRAGAKRVVIGIRDPNPLVNGKAISLLRRSGIQVKTGILAPECRKLNESFITFITSGRPFVALKIAQTLDARIEDGSGRPRRISNEQSRRIVHALRARYDAVLVGANTIRVDDPQLTVRTIKGRDPYRVILDGNMSSPLSARVYRDNNRDRTILFVSRNAARKKRSSVSALRGRGVDVRALEASKGHLLKLESVLQELRRNNVASILVEGGGHTFRSFLKERLVDKIIVFVSPKLFGKGQSVWDRVDARTIRHLILRDVSTWNIGGDVMVESYIGR